MKNLKISISLFLLAAIFSTFNAYALVVTVSDITIPILKGTWISGEKVKGTYAYQYIKKTKCTDDISGDGRVIVARTYNMFGGSNFTAWIEVPYTNATWGAANGDVSNYKLNLQSNKSLLTTASFWGVWTVN